MIEKNVYEVVAEMRKSEIPFTVVFTHVNISKNEGGARDILENQISGPKRHNQNERLMIGLADVNNPNNIRHIYIHSILEVHYQNGTSHKPVLIKN